MCNIKTSVMCMYHIEITIPLCISFYYMYMRKDLKYFWRLTVPCGKVDLFKCLPNKQNFAQFGLDSGCWYITHLIKIPVLQLRVLNVHLTG